MWIEKIKFTFRNSNLFRTLASVNVNNKCTAKIKFTFRNFNKFSLNQNFCRVGQFLTIQLKRFVNFQGTLTKDINFVKCFAKIPIPVILDSDIVEQKKFTLISTVNHSGNLNNSHYTTYVKNNFSHNWYHCNDAAVISCPKKLLKKNTSYILESAKLRALRAKNVLTCQRVLRAYVL